MKRIVATVVLLVVALAVVVYMHFGVSFYVKNSATFGELMERQYNNETFAAIIYDPQSDLSQKAESVFRELAKEKEYPFLTVDRNSIDDASHGLPISNETSVPAFYYFEEGQLKLLVEGYHPLDVYLQGFEAIKNLENKGGGYNEIQKDE